MTRRAAALALCVVAALGGCAATPSPLPAEVTFAVYQPRTDVTMGRLVIRVRNGAEDAVEILAARLSSPDFDGDAVWAGDGVKIPAGSGVDLRAPVPDFTCDVPPEPMVTVEFRTADGTAVVERGASDPHDLLPRLHRDACLGVEIAEIAAITPREVIVPDGRAPAILVLDVAPTGAPGTVILESVDGTTLLQPAFDGRPVDQLELGIEIDADGPTVVRVPFVPNRCDQHALAEDKVGTVIPFTVTTPTAESVRWPLPVTDDQRGDFYAFWTAYCGFPGSPATR